jgi:hypothetical protein
MVTGTLLHGTVSGLPSGQLGGVRIMASGTNYSDSAQTDDSGAYSLHDVPSGVIRLTAMTSLLSGRSTSKVVEVPEGETFRPTSRFRALRAWRTRHARRPAAVRSLRQRAPDPPRASAGRSSGQTDDNGSYALEGLDDGNYNVSVNGQGSPTGARSRSRAIPRRHRALPAISVTGTVTSRLGSASGRRHGPGPDRDRDAADLDEAGRDRFLRPLLH